MNSDFMIGIDFKTKAGIERRVDITPDWQVWADSSKRLENLGPLSAVMIAGYIDSVDTVTDSDGLYMSAFGMYRSLVDGSGAEIIEEIDQDAETRLGSTLNSHFRKLYVPVSGILKYNILSITALTTNRYLLSSDMSDSAHILSVVRNSQLVESTEINNATLQDIVLNHLWSRGYIKRQDTRLIDDIEKKSNRRTRPAESTLQGLNVGMIETPTKAGRRVTKTNNDALSGDVQGQEPQQKPLPGVRYQQINELNLNHVKSEAQSKFTKLSEYSEAMLGYISKLGEEELFDEKTLIEWARTQGWEPNPGDVERRVLLDAARSGIVKKVNALKPNSEVKIMYKLLC